MSGAVRRLRGRCRDDQGTATVEFVFLGVLLLVPLFYLAIAAFDVQANVFAVTHAAREAGRTFATAPDVPTGVYRAQYSVRLAFKNHGIEGGATLRFVASGTSCATGGPAAPNPGAASLEPGAQFTVCVVRDFDVPAVPSFIESESNTISAQYEVQIDKLRVGKNYT